MYPDTNQKICTSYTEKYTHKLCINRYMINVKVYYLVLFYYDICISHFALEKLPTSNVATIYNLDFQK